MRKDPTDVEETQTFVEWRVTGQPDQGYPPYYFVWRRGTSNSNVPNDHILDDQTLEEQARAFVEICKDRWDEGPFLERREVTYTPWEDS